MILILKPDTKLVQAEALQRRLAFMKLEAVLNYEDGQHVLAIVGGLDDTVQAELFVNLPYVSEVSNFTGQFKLVGKSVSKHKICIELKNTVIGADEFVMMAGPCAIESEAQIFAIAEAVSQAGARVLRGGAFKPRTSPYDFQGLGEIGLQYMRAAADHFGLSVVSEVMSVEEIPLVTKYVDILQVGARNMQNYSLLKALGAIRKPILLKRGLSATYKEFLLAAEYIVHCGNTQVILCERGIRTFETMSRNTLDIAAVPILRELTNLPIIVDPSHGTGLRHAVLPMACAALAVNADGAMVEVHTHPDQSISDAQQAISPLLFETMMERLKQIAPAVGMTVNGLTPVEMLGEMA